MNFLEENPMNFASEEIASLRGKGNRQHSLPSQITMLNLRKFQKGRGLYDNAEMQDRASEYTENKPDYGVKESEEEYGLYNDAEMQDRASEYTENKPDYGAEESEEEYGLYNDAEMQDRASEYTENKPDYETEESEEEYGLYDDAEMQDRAFTYTEKGFGCIEIESPELNRTIRRDFEMEVHNESEAAYKYAVEIINRESFCYLNDPDVSNSISRFNGKYWEILSNQQLNGLVYQYISEYDKYQKDGIDIFCKQISTYIKYEVRKQYVEGKYFTHFDFQKIQNRVVFQNLVYDVRTGEKLGFDKNLPYYFAVDAEYTEDEQETPYYEKLKKDATGGDEESMEMFDNMLAYLMIPNRKGKCYFVMASAKDSGKSLLGTFISNMYMGTRSKSIDPEHLGGRFAFSDAGEMVLLSCLEMNTARLKKNAVAQIKRITGEDRIRSEAKYQNEQTIFVRFKLLLATNGGILLPEGMEDEAFYRRTIVIPFIKSTPLDSLISDLDEKLLREKNAILSMCVRKFRRYIGKDGGIVFPESLLSLAIKERWLGGKCMDNEFINRAFSYTGDSKDRVAISDVEDVYHVYIEQQRLQHGNIIVTDRKTLFDKIAATYVGVEKKKSRVSLIKIPGMSRSVNALRRIKWNEDFIRDIGFY